MTQRKWLTLATFHVLVFTLLSENVLRISVCDCVFFHFASHKFHLRHLYYATIVPGTGIMYGYAKLFKGDRYFRTSFG
jgi:hypothetical protein